MVLFAWQTVQFQIQYPSPWNFCVIDVSAAFAVVYSPCVPLWHASQYILPFMRLFGAFLKTELRYSVFAFSACFASWQLPHFGSSSQSRRPLWSEVVIPTMSPWQSWQLLPARNMMPRMHWVFGPG